MNKFSLAMKRFGGFLKRNAFYFLIILCIASVATVIALAVTRNSKQTTSTELQVNNEPANQTPEDKETGGKEDQKPDPEPADPTPTTKTLTFILPCNGTVIRDYSDTVLVWSSTLKQYSTHQGIDFTSEDGNVFASADGSVKEVGYNALDGNYIILAHEDGYITKYMSLAEASPLKVGAKVKQGELIGKMSTSQGTESLDGNHLHFEMYKDNKPVNPNEVFLFEEK